MAHFRLNINGKVILCFHELRRIKGYLTVEKVKLPLIDLLIASLITLLLYENLPGKH